MLVHGAADLRLVVQHVLDGIVARHAYLLVLARVAVEHENLVPHRDDEELALVEEARVRRAHVEPQLTVAAHLAPAVHRRVQLVDVQARLLVQLALQ